MFLELSRYFNHIIKTGEKCSQICLDGQKANSRELDTVAVRVAMHKSRELKSTIAGTKSKRKVKANLVFNILEYYT